MLPTLPRTQLEWPRDNEPGARLGASSIIVGQTMFLFGGLRPSETNSVRTRFMLHKLQEAAGGVAPNLHHPKGDLWALDLQSREWQLLTTSTTEGYEGPSPRGRLSLLPFLHAYFPLPSLAHCPSHLTVSGFGLLAYDADSHSIYLFSGREVWWSFEHSMANTTNKAPLTDMWRFDLNSRTWHQIPGSHPKIEQPGPAAIYEGSFFVVDPHASPENEPPHPLEVLRFDLRAQFWQRMWGGLKARADAPKLVAPLTGWEQDGKLYVYSSAVRSGNTDVSLWSFQLLGGSWKAIDIVSLNNPGHERIEGQPCAGWAEGGCSYDPISRKAYLFGGWTEDNFFFTVSNDGKAKRLAGRYYGTLVQFDIDNLTVRGMESTTKEAPPCLRGFTTVAAFTLPARAEEEGGDVGEGPVAARSSVLVGYGYTTFDPIDQVYKNFKPFGDLWECSILPSRDPKAAVPDPTSGKFMRSMTGMADPLSLSSGNVVEIRTFNLQDAWNQLRDHVVHNSSVRKFMGDMAPTDRGPGAFVGLGPQNRETGAAYTPEQFFSASHLTWLTEAEIYDRLPDFHIHEVEIVEWLRTVNGATHWMIIGIAQEGEQVKACSHTGAPYMTFASYFRRYSPHHDYFSVLDGEMVEVQDPEERKAIKPVTQQVEQRVEVCANQQNCPDFMARIQAAQTPGGDREFPILKACSQCHLAKYCSPACQKMHWPHHKKYCKAAAPRSSKSVKSKK